MRYRTLLIDLDHTLFDSDASELAAFAQTMQVAGVARAAPYFASFARINRALWAAVERHELTPAQVRNERFERFVAETSLKADPRMLADTFVAGLGANGTLYPGALDVLDVLAPIATMALVTNGLGEVQRARIERLGIDDYFAAIVISGEVGVAKPGNAIYDLTFEALGQPERETALMIGDSLSSDMQGGAGYGIATCWYNVDGHPRPPNGLVTHQIDDLGLLPELVRSGALP